MVEFICGIDPGKTGAIVFIGDNRYIMKAATPIDGKIIDWNTYSNMLTKITPKKIKHVFVEQVHALFGSSAGATFEFGGAYYGVIAMLSALKIPYTLVQPKIWQKEMFQGIPEIRKPSVKIAKGKRIGQMKKGSLETKKMSLVAAKRLFPTFDLRKSDRCKKPHDGIVDALLIAEYGRRLLK